MSQKKRVLLITPDFPPNRGGVARYLSNLAAFFHDQITVVAGLHPAWQTTDTKTSYPVYRMRLLYRFLWPRWMKTYFYLRSVRRQYDTVLTSHVLPIGTAVMMAKIPYIVFVHGMDIRLAKRNAQKKRLATKVLKAARLVVVNSKALAKEVLTDFGVQSLVIYPCLKAPDGEGRWEGETLELLTVSRLIERKGHAIVLNVLGTLRRASRLQKFQYHIVGTGPMEKTLRSMVHELSLESHVTFHGDVTEDELQMRYAAADIFVMPVLDDPVDKEGFGYVFLEAAAHGTPSITSRISGVDEAVLDGQTGLLITPGSEQELAGAIERLTNDSELRKELGRAARARTKAEFTCEKQFSKLQPYL